MIVLLDNYDSFTYNLYQYLGELGAEVQVVRNDDMSADAVLALAPERVVISPGPGTPDQAGISLDLIRRVAGRVPLLGVCLGHQALGQAFGGRVVRATRLMHGKTSEIHHDGRRLFAGLPQPFTATRYHSLVIDRASVPDALEISAWTDDGTVMGLRHRELPLEGVQFHPESILTAAGKDLLRNFLHVSAGSARTGDGAGDASPSDPQGVRGGRGAGSVSGPAVPPGALGRPAQRGGRGRSIK